jgi:hypothetical protein
LVVCTVRLNACWRTSICFRDRRMKAKKRRKRPEKQERKRRRQA